MICVLLESVLNLGFSTPARWAKFIPGLTLCLHKADKEHTWRWEQGSTPRLSGNGGIPSVSSGHWKITGVPVALTLENRSLGF